MEDACFFRCDDDFENRIFNIFYEVNSNRKCFNGNLDKPRFITPEDKDEMKKENKIGEREKKTITRSQKLCIRREEKFYLFFISCKLAEMQKKKTWHLELLLELLRHSEHTYGTIIRHANNDNNKQECHAEL